MEIKLSKRDWLFFGVCLLLGVASDQTFLHGQIGISYVLFLTLFYGVFFLRFRKRVLTNKRVGGLVLVCIWLLAISYTFNSNWFFYTLNLLLIPVLVMWNLLLLSRNERINWRGFAFVRLIKEKIVMTILFIFAFISLCFRKMTKGMQDSKVTAIKKVGLGLLITVPLLYVIVSLLIDADDKFGEMLGAFPDFLTSFINMEDLFRVIFILLMGVIIFGYLFVLGIRNKDTETKVKNESRPISDGIMAMTILFIINLVYALFTAVQFTYFFSKTLEGDVTYAENAREGFSQLLLVTLINWTIMLTILRFVEVKGQSMKRILQGLLSLLIIFSGIMLASAFQRLQMYEEAFGFTMSRVIAHAFMIFLIVIFSYSIINIWLPRLSIVHFYFLAGLLFYTGLNSLPLEQFIVDQNVKRYEKTGKIDIHYLNSFSYKGVEALVKLNETNPDIPDLKNILADRLSEFNESTQTWQSYNISRERAYQKVRESQR